MYARTEAADGINVFCSTVEERMPPIEFECDPSEVAVVLEKMKKWCVANSQLTRWACSKAMRVMR